MGSPMGNRRKIRWETDRKPMEIPKWVADGSPMGNRQTPWGWWTHWKFAEFRKFLGFTSSPPGGCASVPTMSRRYHDDEASHPRSPPTTSATRCYLRDFNRTTRGTSGEAASCPHCHSSFAITPPCWLLFVDFYWILRSVVHASPSRSFSPIRLITCNSPVTHP